MSPRHPEGRGSVNDTIVVLTSDHGDMMGSHGLLAKTVMYEESVTVPLLIKAPGLEPRTERHVVSQVDLVPTLLDMLGAMVPETLQGISLRPLLESGKPPSSSDVFVEWTGTDEAPSMLGDAQAIPDYLKKLGSPEQLRRASVDPLRTVITENRWKLVHSPNLECHALYDLNADPLECNNLYGAAEHTERVEVMRRRLRQWGARTGDDVASAI
ncbi:MAG TPA: DUF4976 domain-containing protein [Candidatus Hydrogenedentes bacterium]|nr:DUF4976 domain-containing protein [Candidatus Hydrogenedentota bacterium]